MGSSGTVWAIEPVPGNCEQLRDLSERNDLKAIRTFEVAAGARDGCVVLRLPPPGNSAVASVTASWINGGEITVPVRSVDSLVAEHGSDRRLALIKIDVEGLRVAGPRRGERDSGTAQTSPVRRVQR